ncbi:MAG: DUF222 domain-containing protein, partial [Pseudomonadales bacterium]
LAPPKILDYETFASFLADNAEREDRIGDLENELIRIAGLTNAMDYYFIKLLADFDESEAWMVDGVKSLPHWLNWRIGLGSMMAREKVRVARALRDLPQIDEAFRTGEISYSKVRAITRAARPENEEYLLMIAKSGTARHVELLVQRYRRCKEYEALMESENAWKASCTYLDWYQDEAGMYVFNGRLPAEEGEMVAKALDQMRDQMLQARKEEQISSKIHDEGKEHERECNNVSAETPMPRPPFHDTTFTDKFGLTNASALNRICEHFLSSSKTNEMSSSTRNHLVIHVNANEANIEHKIAGGPACYLEQGRFLAPEVARRLACDAKVTTVLEDDDGTVLNIGRKSRVVPPQMALALDIRDKGCRFPSCYQQRWTESHHIQSWADGGDTSMDNLITLCRYHHTLLHDGKYRIEKCEGDGDDNQGVKFIGPKGEEIVRALDPQFPGTVDPKESILIADEFHRKRGIEIDHQTADSKWDGGPMDWDFAIESMFSLESNP